MGGTGSGGNNRLSDAERKRLGTFRENQSDAVYDKAAASKVVTGPWLETIPEPTLPLNEVGKKKYDDLTRALHSQNKLTLVTQMQAEVAARQYEKIHDLSAKGSTHTASDVAQLQRALDALKIAEDAPPLTSAAGRYNKFAACGFSNRRNAQVKLRGSAGSRPGN